MRAFKLDPNALEVSTFEPATPAGQYPEAAAQTANTCQYASCVWACVPTEDRGCTLNGEQTCICG